MEKYNCKDEECINFGNELNESDLIITKEVFKNGTTHLKAITSCCKNFVKWMPQGLPPTLYFGKYEGRTIQEVALLDLAYLKWLYGETKNAKLKEKIGKVIYQ